MPQSIAKQLKTAQEEGGECQAFIKSPAGGVEVARINLATMQYEYTCDKLGQYQVTLAYKMKSTTEVVTSETSFSVVSTERVLSNSF